jgi:uncharacterized OsmC-like protein
MSAEHPPGNGVKTGEDRLMLATVSVALTAGPDKLVTLPLASEPVAMGMHDELAEFYGAQPASFEPRASTLDFVVGALAACLAGTFKRALLARGVPLRPEDLETTGVGTIVVVDRVPTIRSVAVSYVLANADPADHEKINRAHAVHDRGCAVSRSLEAAIAISTTLQLV